MKKTVFIIIFFLQSFLFAQSAINKVHTEVHTVIGSNNRNICYISYRISYNNLVFVKDASKNYSTGFSITVETSLGKDEILRESKKEFFAVKDYELTKSAISFFEGLLRVELPDGEYSLLLSIQLDNSALQYKMEPIELKVNSGTRVISPLVIYNSEKKNLPSQLLNYNGTIPYSKNNYSLLIPVKDTTVNLLQIDKYQYGKLVKSLVVKDKITASYKLSDYNGQIFVKKDSLKEKYNLFIVKNINADLFEGKTKIVVTSKEKNYSDTFHIDVNWINKPKTLQVEELPTKLLQIAFSNVDVGYINDEDSLVTKRLFEFWKKYDPDKNTSFNQLMEEYYRRADYAIENFSNRDVPVGAFTDRGKTYIKYGVPSDVKRIYTKKNKTNELWIYTNIKKEFLFEDQDGLGNYQLVR